MNEKAPKRFAIGADIWPGLSKLLEEAGEVVQIGGKLMGTAGKHAHWDGSDLRDRLTEELADLTAAVEFFIAHNPIDRDEVTARAATKLATYNRWHREQGRTVVDPLPDPS